MPIFGLCKLCGRQRTLIKCHIIPEAFHKDLRVDPNSVRSIDTSADGRVKRNPGGLYDPEIVCDECEHKYLIWDGYGADCLLRDFERDTHTFLNADGSIESYRTFKWDESKLRMFALSLLWRAGATKQEWFSTVKLGPYEERLRKIVLAGVPGDPDYCSVTLGRWVTESHTKDFTGMQVSPMLGKINGVNVVWLIFGNGWICIKCDQRRYPDSVRYATLAPGKPVIFIAQGLQDSELMGIYAKAHAKLHGNPRTDILFPWQKNSVRR